MLSLKPVLLKGGWGIGQIVREFQGKVWNKCSVERLMQKVLSTGYVSRKERGSAGPRTAGTEDNKAGNKAYVEDAIAFPRNTSPGLINHKEKLPRNSMSVICLYPNC
jgi:hypothetical protein